MCEEGDDRGGDDHLFSNFSRSQSGSMTAEEFHSALQEATNYSLKGFVLPHLKQQLPSLQRDLSNAARASNQVSFHSLARFRESRQEPAANFYVINNTWNGGLHAILETVESTLFVNRLDNESNE